MSALRPALIPAALALAACASVSLGQVTYIGRAAIPGGPSSTFADYSGLPHTLLEDNTSYQDRFDGFGSGMTYTGFNNRFVFLNDRGPNKTVFDPSVDNTTSYRTRFQIADVTLTGSGNSYNVNLNLVGTSMLRNEAGQNFTGRSDAFVGPNATQNLRLDPEGIAVHRDGSVYISDEYGPVIYRMDQSGQRTGTLPVPSKFLIANPSATVNAEIAGNTSGRVGNKGMEGLAVTPNGNTLIGALQSPLIQDGGVNGTNIRFLKYDITQPTLAPREFVYQLDTSANLVSEITPVNNHQFLVDERDAVGGASGGIKKLYLIDLDQAQAPTDVTSLGTLATTGQTVGVTPLSKTLFADIGSLLRSAPGALNGGLLPDKFEGFSFGPDLPDGRHVLFATNDNDYSTTYPNYLFAFAVDANYFSDFQGARLSNGVSFIPAPGAAALLALGGLACRRRRP